MKKVMFSLSQKNGNIVKFEFETLPEGITQDKFSGTYLFPAMLRLTKGASKLFDRKLPVFLSFSAELANDEFINRTVAQITLKSSSVNAVRKAVLVFNEAIAGLIIPAVPTSIYSIADMKGDKGVGLRNLSASLLRPSVSLSAALAN